MAGFMKNAMSYFGMSDVVDDEMIEDPAQDGTSFDEDHSVATGIQHESMSPQTTPFPSKMNRITTIHPRSYEDAQMVGRAVRDGIPVVLNLTDVPESIAYRIVDFSSGVVFGVRGSIERVTPRVFLLSPAQVNIRVEKNAGTTSAHDIFAE